MKLKHTYQNILSDVRKLIQYLPEKKVKKIHVVDSVDDWLSQRISQTASEVGITIETYDSPLFLNSDAYLRKYFSSRKRMFQTDFYKEQRKLRKILLESKSGPLGGKWTYDSNNRKKYPGGKVIPVVQFPEENSFFNEARTYVSEYFPNNPGSPGASVNYPVTFDEADKWLDDFLNHRFADFGPYEDAILQKEHFLHHSLLSPLMNVGLISPKHIIQKSLVFAEQHTIPLNSTEGFIRQILGWREFIRAVYILKGREERTRNFWGFSRKIPDSFWQGNTGILPVDDVIKKVLSTGYAHHIERLMVLGNFMLLCEFDPDEVYQWFMPLFIDAYDWVMVPNIYGMSQFADGGLMATKPYISGSNYLMKMSDYPSGEWQKIWDGLFWRFVYVHRDFFMSNPRLGMMVRTFDKMPEIKQQAHLSLAEKFLVSLDHGK
jgi:deoxyribodipyrimidine photolyase-related protein